MDFKILAAHWTLLNLKYGLGLVFKENVLFETTVVENVQIVALELNNLAVVFKLLKTNRTIPGFLQHELRVRKMAHGPHDVSILNGGFH